MKPHKITRLFQSRLIRISIGCVSLSPWAVIEVPDGCTFVVKLLFSTAVDLYIKCIESDSRAQTACTAVPLPCADPCPPRRELDFTTKQSFSRRRSLIFPCSLQTIIVGFLFESMLTGIGSVAQKLTPGPRDLLLYQAKCTQAIYLDQI
jgi:hypothetical protein